MGKNGVYYSKSRASGHLIGSQEASFDTQKNNIYFEVRLGKDRTPFSTLYPVGKRKSMDYNRF